MDMTETRGPWFPTTGGRRAHHAVDHVREPDSCVNPGSNEISDGRCVPRAAWNAASATTTAATNSTTATM